MTSPEEPQDQPEEIEPQSTKEKFLSLLGESHPEQKSEPLYEDEFAEPNPVPAYIVLATFATLVCAGGLATYKYSEYRRNSDAAEKVQQAVAAKQTAENRGFLQVVPRGNKPRQMFVQFGACMLPAEAIPDKKASDHHRLWLDVGTNLEHNLGVVDQGVYRQVTDAFQDITYTKLAQLTEAGVTGLANCYKTVEEHRPQVAAILGTTATTNAKG